MTEFLEYAKAKYKRNRVSPGNLEENNKEQK